MFLTQQAIAAHPRLMGHFQELQANRNIWNTQNAAMLNAHRAAMTPDMLQANALAGLGREFWAEIDRQVIQLRDQEVGMEIVNDLLTVQTVLPIGKTAKLYNVVGDIADDVSVSLDGQAPYSFDHTEYNSDGDPIPVFTAGYGVNWRHAAGMNTVGIDLVLDSQQAKMRKFNKKLVSYTLDGSENIQVDTYQGQGLRNHRNTIKVNLGSGAGGANIDLTTATAAELIAFFSTGAFGQAAMNNKVVSYDVVWLSPQIMLNMSQAYFVNGQAVGTVMDQVKRFAPRVREFRETFALSGNEFLGYQRRQDVVSPLVGMATGVVPLPRPLPQVNYNFQIMAAMGIQVKRDDEGLSGVIYGANIA
ncbi:major capsid protein [Stutzerimonas nitrititolerans]|uniref:major capsid protein n=1 Tax=Stutzerimonas nitrititolerans TaxID=2482751 RepID=UPI0028B21AF9|nr:major capsid protein [Stutzerimonas nitrititolerans]